MLTAWYVDQYLRIEYQSSAVVHPSLVHDEESMTKPLKVGYL